MSIFDNNTSLYFYSAVFQGNMALLALIGVFVVYKLQILSNVLLRKDDQIISLIEEFCKKSIGSVPDFLWDILRSPDEFETKVKEKLGDPEYKVNFRPYLQTLIKNPELNNHLEDRRQIIRIQEKIVTEMKLPFSVVLAVIIVSLVLLPMSLKLHCQFPMSELFAVIGTVILNIIALTLNTKFVFKTLREK